MSSSLEELFSSRFTSTEDLHRLISEFCSRSTSSYTQDEVVAYLAGIQFAKRFSGWRKFDECNTEALVGDAQYLVKAHSADQRWCEIMTWNAVHQCWDDAEGDDYACDKVSMYKPIDLDV